MDPKIKKRGSTKQPADSKAAKKKKKDTTVASNLPVPPNSTNPIRTASAVPIAATTAATSAEQEHPPVTTTTTAPPVAATNSKTTIGGTTNISNRPLVDQVLYRLTEGVPRMELKAVVREADECERALLQELQLLEEALKEETSRSAGNAATKDTTEPQDDAALEKENAVNAMLQTPLTPLDRSFTLSSLLGRLRDELALPSIRRPTPAAVAAAGAASNKKKKGNTNPAPTYPQLVALADHPKYTRAHPPADNNNNAPPPQLMQVWRKISSHRASTVFRKAVKPEEAPGYTDRILFPMDLSLVRKMIQARILTSFAEVHQKLRLISHNCVKYNGRESDYGIVAREFEAVVDEYIAAAVYQHPPVSQQQQRQLPASGRSSPKTTFEGGSGRSSPATGAAASSSAPSNINNINNNNNNKNTKGVVRPSKTNIL